MSIFDEIRADNKAMIDELNAIIAKLWKCNMNKYYIPIILIMFILIALIGGLVFGQLDQIRSLEQKVNNLERKELKNNKDFIEIYGLVESMSDIDIRTIQNQSIIKSKVDEHDKTLTDMFKYIKAKNKGRLW